MKRADSSWNGHSSLTATDQLSSSALSWEAGCPLGQGPLVLPKLHTVAISSCWFTMLLKTLTLFLKSCFHCAPELQLHC